MEQETLVKTLETNLMNLERGVNRKIGRKIGRG
jgi:hypothetical protein